MSEALQLLLSLVAANPGTALPALHEVHHCSAISVRTPAAIGMAELFAMWLLSQEDAMTEVFASNLQTGLAPGRTAARKILARLARQVRFPGLP